MQTLKEKDMKKTMIISMEDYREEMKVLKAQDKPGNSTFLTDKEDKITEDKPSFCGKQQQQSKGKQQPWSCVCQEPSDTNPYW